MSELPEGWAKCEIGDVATVAGGGTPDSHDLQNFSTDNGIAWLTPADLSGYQQIYISRGQRFLTEKGFKQSSAKLLPRGTVLFSSRAPIGYVAIAANEISTNQGFKSFVCGDGVNSQYLYYWLRFATPLAEELASGTTFPEISGKNASRIPLRLAPVDEQLRIAAKLEKLVGRVDVVQARLVTIPRILKRFRQSVLAAACSGRLTADWRENNVILESAGKLFSQIQRERKRYYKELCHRASLKGKRRPKNSDSNAQSRSTVGELPELPTTWGYFRLDEVSHLVTDGTHKTPKYFGSGKPFLSVKNVRPFLIRDADIKFISEEEHQEINSRCNPEKGDILYTKVGATFGYAAENVLSYPFSIFVSLALIKPVIPFFSSKFAELAMNSEVVFSQARERVSGIGTPDLHLVEIRDFRIPLPPVAEQQEIVRRVEALFKTADAIEARYRTAKAHVDKLMQSILAKAFRGELVPQDPNDEPASVLVERVRSQRKTQESKSLRNKKTSSDRLRT